jgi:hypothetical protein
MSFMVLGPPCYADGGERPSFRVVRHQRGNQRHAAQGDRLMVRPDALIGPERVRHDLIEGPGTIDRKCVAQEPGFGLCVEPRFAVRRGHDVVQVRFQAWIFRKVVSGVVALDFNRMPPAWTAARRLMLPLQQMEQENT